MVEKQSTIRSLKFPDNVRQNPGMLLGELKDASILLREIFDNSRDELIASSNCDTVWINNESELITVIDNGRGISVEISAEDPEMTQMELAVGSIYAGGKYDSKEVSGGIHGIGSSAVNAVSDTFIIACKITARNWEVSNTIVRNYILESSKDPNWTANHLGKYLFLKYERGIKLAEYVGTHKDIHDAFGDVPEWMSTYVGFIPDLTMVKSAAAPFSSSWYEYTFEVLRRFYNKDNVRIILNGKEMQDNYQPMRFEVQKTINLSWPGLNDKVDLYLTWEFDTDLSKSDYSGSVNMITVNNGMNIELAKWIITHNLKTVFGIHHKYITPGLKFDCILLAKKVGYNSQTKEKLVKIADFCDDDWYKLDEEVKAIYNENYDEVYRHVQRLNEYADSLQTIATKDYIKKMVNSAALEGTSYARSYTPAKLKDCSSADRSQCELMIVEGDSAGGSIMKTRDPSTQAVMGMRGKSLNTTYRTLEDIFQNQEIKDIISAIGMGVDDYNNTTNARYSKIIIASDSDADGGHITALLLGLFCFHMRFLIDQGFVYILESPLFKQHDGKYIYPGQEHTLDKTQHFTRFKGLGSLDTDQLIREVLTDRNTRRLIRVTQEGLQEAISTVGDKYFRKRIMIEAGLVEER